MPKKSRERAKPKARGEILVTFVDGYPATKRKPSSADDMSCKALAFLLQLKQVVPVLDELVTFTWTNDADGFHIRVKAR